MVVVVLVTTTNRMESLRPLVPNLLKVLPPAKPGQLLVTGLETQPPLQLDPAGAGGAVQPAEPRRADVGFEPRGVSVVKGVEHIRPDPQRDPFLERDCLKE